MLEFKQKWGQYSNKLMTLNETIQEWYGPIHQDNNQVSSYMTIWLDLLTSVIPSILRYM